MAIPENSGQIVAIIASLGMLTPLVKALHRWHLDVRKTSKLPQGTQDGPTKTIQIGSRWSKVPRFEKIKFVYGALGHMACLIILLVSMLFPPHPATSRDVAMAAILVLSAISVGRFMEE